MKKILAVVMAVLVLTGCEERIEYDTGNFGGDYEIGTTGEESTENVSGSGTESTESEVETGTEETDIDPETGTTGTEGTGSDTETGTTETEGSGSDPETGAAEEDVNFHRDMSFEELEFSGITMIYEGATYTTTKYSGSITGDTKEKLWLLLGDIQEGKPYELDDNDTVGGGGYEALTVKNTRTGKEFRIYGSILYDNPMEEGGPCVIVIEGIPSYGRNYSCYGHVSEICPSDALSALIREGVACEENIIEQTTEDPVPYKADIVLVSNYRNWAEGFECYGSFIDFEGNIYKFDFSDRNWMDISSDEDLMCELEKGHFNHLFGDPAGTFEDIDLLWDIAILADQISENAVITKEHKGYDMGQDVLYAVSGEHRLIEINSFGDYDRVNTDENAEKIAEICKENGIL